MNWKKLLLGTWSWKRPFYLIFWVYSLLALYGCFMADSLIFQPPGTAYPENRFGFSTLDEGEKQVAIFHLKPGPGMPTILWSHGNAQNLESLKPALEYLHLNGFGVISYDYPGYGESAGEPTEAGCYRAVEQTYDYLIETAKLKPEEIVLIGQSVGTGPTCWLASRKEHRAVVLISPFLSAFRTVTQIPLFPGDRFPNLRHIREFKTPLLIIHGEEDEVIPFTHGVRLFRDSPSPEKTFLPVPNAGHNDLFTAGQFELTTEIRKLLKWKPGPAGDLDQKTETGSLME